MTWPSGAPARQRRPKRRTWTLATLLREIRYTLWYDPEVNRWEVAPTGTDTPIRTTAAP